MRVTPLCALLALLLAGCATAQPEPLTGLTEAEQAEYAQSFALQWSGIQLDDPPSIAVVAYVPADDWGAAVAGCMNSEGYDGYVGSGDGFSFPARDDTDEAQNRALYTCIGRYPVRADYSAYANHAQLEFLYDYFQDSLIPCIEANGYDVPNTAPARQEFVAYTVAPRWNPYKVMTDRATNELLERCPPSPFVGGLTVRY
jgi:hypothetical protein